MQMELVSIRMTAEDLERLDRYSAMFPSMSRTAVAREAMRRGLDAIDEADRIKDAAERVATLARLVGMVGTERPKRRGRKA